jgi:hypothetical protein
VVEDLLPERPAMQSVRQTHELVGRQLPPFTLPDLSGMERTSSEWAERKFILNFFAGW